MMSCNQPPCARREGCLLTHEPAEAYHAQSGEYLSSHALADFRKCPLLYRRKQLGQIADEDQPAYLVGRAAHTLILEGREQFDREYVLGGPINQRTGKPYAAKTKTARQWARLQGKTPLSKEDFETARAMNEAVHSHEVARDYLAVGEAEGVVRENYCGVPCQIRIDWFDSHRGIVDLKTCKDLAWFESDARLFGYAHQLAFYRAVLAEQIGINTQVHLIAVEKKQPFRVGVWRVHEDVLAKAQRDNEAAIERLKACRQFDHWPTLYESIRVFDFI